MSEPPKAEVFQTKEDMERAHPDASWAQWGPVLKYKGRLFVQTYMGQHEWWIYAVDDIRESYPDPGYWGTSFGCGYIADEWVEVVSLLSQNKEELGSPEREGKPITGDAITFGDRKKLLEYLGPEDPLYAELSNPEESS